METRFQKKQPKCNICYEIVQSIGDIFVCQHIFCFDCIYKWSQVQNTCPICRIKFNKIKKRQIKYASRKFKSNVRLIERQDEITIEIEKISKKPCLGTRFQILFNTIQNNQIISHQDLFLLHDIVNNL